MSLARTNFSWPTPPTNTAEFEALMKGIDAHLEAKHLKPWQRPLHVGLLLWQAFKWEGKAFPPRELARQSGFSGPVLMAKAQHWYEEVYGDSLNTDWGIGHAPVRLVNGLWRVRFPLVYGRCQMFIDRNLANRGSDGLQQRAPARLNILCCVDELPPGLAARLTDDDLKVFTDFFRLAFDAFAWRAELKGHHFFDEARHDYDSSVDDLLNGHYAQSRWASSQAVEKTLKGLLDLGKLTYSTRGSAGHDLKELGGQLSKLGMVLNEHLLSIASCSPKVRYGEPPSSQTDALLANHAALEIFERLATSGKTTKLLPGTITP